MKKYHAPDNAIAEDVRAFENYATGGEIRAVYLADDVDAHIAEITENCTQINNVNQQRIAEMERALRACLGVFDHPNFTDRHGMAAMVRKALGL